MPRFFYPYKKVGFCPVDKKISLRFHQDFSRIVFPAVLNSKSAVTKAETLSAHKSVRIQNLPCAAGYHRERRGTLCFTNLNLLAAAPRLYGGGYSGQCHRADRRNFWDSLQPPPIISVTCDQIPGEGSCLAPSGSGFREIPGILPVLFS